VLTSNTREFFHIAAMVAASGRPTHRLSKSLLLIRTFWQVRAVETGGTEAIPLGGRHVDVDRSALNPGAIRKNKTTQTPNIPIAQISRA